MKFLFLLCLFGLSFYDVFSQENPNSTAIQTSMKVKALQEKKAEYHRRTNGECDGYRIKIHFSADRSKANEVKARFISKYNDVPTHDDYQQPNFVVNVGDFKTKLEAYELLKKIQVDFPYAFIVKSKVKPMKL
jgi:hypothetical protein